MGNANLCAQPLKIHKDRKEGDFAFHVAQIPEKVDNPRTDAIKPPAKVHRAKRTRTNKKPNEHVTVIARAAGKLWSRMTPEQRKKYVDLANEEKKRRQERKRKRKRSCRNSRILQMQARDVIAFLCPG